MPVKFQELSEAFEFVSASGGLSDHQASICRETGKVYWHGEPDLEELEGVPDDIDDESKYIPVPDKRELDLGKPLVMKFAREILPDDYDEVRHIFSKRGAYQKFKNLLARRNAIDRWHDFEDKATERALRDWCEANSIELDG